MELIERLLHPLDWQGTRYRLLRAAGNRIRDLIHYVEYRFLILMFSVSDRGDRPG